jgi:speckle-type POZ protein
MSDISEKLEGRGNQKVKAWCRSQSEAVEVEFDWFIEKFSLKPQKQGSFFKSSLFADPTGHNWNLDIYPRGQTTAGYISLFLVLGKPKAAVMTRFKFTLMNNKGKILSESGPHSLEFSSALNYQGESKLISLKDVYKEENEFFPDDLLHVKCELGFQIKETTISGFYSDEELPLSAKKGSWISQMTHLFDSKSFSDVVFDVKGRKFEAHKFILTTRSPVFQAMFQSDLVVKNIYSVKIEDIEPEAFNEFLRFIYTDQVENLNEFAPLLLPFADKYMLDLLKAQCESSLSCNISVETCGKLLLLAHLHSANGLKEKVLDFVRCHSVNVIGTTGWQELLQLSDSQLLRDISMAMMTPRSQSIKK